MIAGTVMLMINVAVELPKVASLTVTSMENVPGAVGVPVIVLPDAERPGGRPEKDHDGDAHAVPLHVAENVQL